MTELTSTLNKFKNLNAALPPHAARVLLNAYLLLAMTLVPTVLGAYFGVLYPYYEYFPGWIGAGILFVVLIGGIFAIHLTAQSVVSIYFLMALTLLMGYIISPAIEEVAGMEGGFSMVATAFGGTAALFVGLSLYGRMTNFDFTGYSLRRMMSFGLALMIILSIFNILFIQLSLLSFLISCGVLAICSILIVVETNDVVRGGESNYVIVTLRFYLSLMNIFLSLIRILAYLRR